MSTPTTDTPSSTVSLSAQTRTLCSTTAPTSVPTPAPTPTPAFITETVFHALMDEVSQRLNAAESYIAILVAEIDELKAA